MCDSCGAHASGSESSVREWNPAKEFHLHEAGHVQGGDHDPHSDHAHGRVVSGRPPGDTVTGALRVARLNLERASGDLLDANRRTAQRIRAELAQRGIALFNITSAPGSGKTSLLQSTLRRLPQGSAAVLVGDLETDRDAGRLRGLGAQVLQINTGKGCHLSAAQLAAALDRLDLRGVEMVLVENVGNMACPADYDLGEHGRVAVLSLPEGDDKVAKYPGLFAAADVVLLNKIDLLGVLPFDEELLKSDLARLNTRAPLLKVSALGGQGLEAWVEWLRMRRARVLQGD